MFQCITGVCFTMFPNFMMLDYSLVMGLIFLYVDKLTARLRSFNLMLEEMVISSSWSWVT